MKLSRHFEKALVYATRIHGGQLRKKTGIPYIAHILGVTAIAMEYGANETEATLSKIGCVCMLFVNLSLSRHI